MLEDRRDVAREEVAALAESDDQRAVLADADDHTRMARCIAEIAKDPLQLADGAEYGLQEIALVVGLDQVRDDLAVGLRPELVARARSASSAGRGSSR